MFDSEGLFLPPPLLDSILTPECRDHNHIRSQHKTLHSIAKPSGKPSCDNRCRYLTHPLPTFHRGVSTEIIPLDIAPRTRWRTTLGTCPTIGASNPLYRMPTILKFIVHFMPLPPFLTIPNDKISCNQNSPKRCHWEGQKKDTHHRPNNTAW